MEANIANAKPHAENPHGQHDEVEAMSARRGSRIPLRKRIGRFLALVVGAWCGSLCASITLSPSSQTVSASGGSYSFTIAYTGTSLSYQSPSVSDSWIHRNGLQVSTSAGTITVKYSVDANTSSTSRSGSIYGEVNGFNYIFNINQPGQGTTPPTPGSTEVTFYGGGKTLGTKTFVYGTIYATNPDAAAALRPTRKDHVLTGWYDANDNILFDANFVPVDGKYWAAVSGGYKWIYTGTSLTAYAHWAPVSSQYTVTFYGGGKTLGTATMETGKNTNQAAASVHKPTRAGYVLSGWYDANDNIMFDAQGCAVNGKYWNGSYVKGQSSATWI